MNKPPARGRGAAQLGTGEPRLEDENPEEAVERSGEGSARAGGGKLGRCRQLADGKEAAPPQRAAARPVPDELRRERRLFTRLHGDRNSTEAERQQKAAVC